MNRVSFNYDAFISVFADFYAVTGINISIFEPPVKVSVYDKTLNYANCITYTTSYPPGLCGHIRQNKRVDAQCLRSDENAVNEVMTSGRTLIYECPFGFREALIPAILDGEVAAIIFIGQLNEKRTPTVSTIFIVCSLIPTGNLPISKMRNYNSCISIW